ncbi:hypothetical protein ACP70R_007381 [Stipagrostis hirtigluma subsp. patula]
MAARGGSAQSWRAAVVHDRGEQRWRSVRGCGGGGTRPWRAAAVRRSSSEPCRFEELQYLPLVLLLPDHVLKLLRVLPTLLRPSRVLHKALAVCLDRLVSSRCPGVLSELFADLRDPQNKYLPKPNTCVYKHHHQALCQERRTGGRIRSARRNA